MFLLLFCCPHPFLLLIMPVPVPGSEGGGESRGNGGPSYWTSANLNNSTSHYGNLPVRPYLLQEGSSGNNGGNNGGMELVLESSSPLLHHPSSYVPNNNHSSSHHTLSHSPLPTHSHTQFHQMQMQMSMSMDDSSEAEMMLEPGGPPIQAHSSHSHIQQGPPHPLVPGGSGNSNHPESASTSSHNHSPATGLPLVFCGFFVFCVDCVLERVCINIFTFV